MRRSCVLLALALLGLFHSELARAQAGVFDPELERAVQALKTAKGPEAYVRLRDIFRVYSITNPQHVEEALRGAAQNRRFSAPVRAYANTLLSFVQTRRGDLNAAVATIHGLGFVDKWLTLGPFDNEGKAGFNRAFEPESLLKRPIVPGQAFSGKERPVRWRRPPEVFGYGWLDFGALMLPKSAICGYATTFVKHSQLTRGVRPATVWVGASGAFKVFWNGREVLADSAYRGHDTDRWGTKVDLAPGYNQLTVKLCGEAKAPMLSVRVADAKGEPDPGLLFDNQLQTSADAVETVREQKGSGPFDSGVAQKSSPSAASSEPSEKLGPLAEFEMLAQNPKVTPEVLYEYALYLAKTSGDDRSQHQARDLAVRAAEEAPTLPRLLLAARLAEDHNQERLWLDRAVALDQKNAERDIDVLLAQASHAEESPNWRDAFVYVDQVLALRPDNAEAIAAKVSLFNEAGLPRTGLTFLESAAQRNPESLQLRGLLVAQLKNLGRSLESSSVARAYSARNFDDRSTLTQMVALSLARQDREASEFWLERLLALNPDSQWALGFAANTYRALGQPQRAVATLERALELSPDDVGTLRSIADMQGGLGRRDLELSYLRKLLEVQPQEKSVRQYVDYLAPSDQKPDEVYAWPEERFLKLRAQPRLGESQRTLRDLTVTTVFPNGLSRTFRQVVFQPLTDTAAAELRQYAFGYEASQQSVQLRGAKVFRADGRVDEAIESGEGAADDPSISMYTSGRNFYVQFPRLEPGDVVELRYRIDDITPRNEFADYFGDMVYLQSNEPVQNAEYVLITPKSRKIYIDHNLKNLRRVDADAGDQHIARFSADAVPALVAEPSMPPATESLGYIHVSTYKDWKELGRWYWGLVQDQFDLDAETKRLAEKITAGKTTELDKVKAIYGWVVKNTRYVALEFGIYGYKPRRSVQTVNRGWGDCKDKATVIVSLLKAVGIKSTIVLVRTQMRGNTATPLASLALFDHAIAYVPSLNLFLDGTAEFTSALELPLMDRESQGLLVNEGDAVPVTLPTRLPESDQVNRVVEADLRANGEAKVGIKVTALGAEASGFRRRYHAKGTLGERLLIDLGQTFPGLHLDMASLKTSDLEDNEATPWLEASATVAGFGRREGDRLSVRVTPDPRLTANYAALSARKQDVRVLGLTGVDDTFTVQIPQGYRVEIAPASVSEASRFGSYAIEVKTSGRAISFRSKLLVSATRIAPKDYAAWQRFCAAVDTAFSTRLVLTPSR
ncbi:MAG: DUF3857 domain-containing protein [Polyangiaceae bacterium]|nr:DUF3857 domain-containing protein [Polyangiaceae bacterium]